MRRLIAILICAIAVTMCETTNGDKVYPTGKINSKKDNKRELDDVKEKDDFNYNSYCQFLIVE